MWKLNRECVSTTRKELPTVTVATQIGGVILTGGDSTDTTTAVKWGGGGGGGKCYAHHPSMNVDSAIRNSERSVAM